MERKCYMTLDIAVENGKLRNIFSAQRWEAAVVDGILFFVRNRERKRYLRDLFIRSTLWMQRYHVIHSSSLLSFFLVAQNRRKDKQWITWYICCRSVLCIWKGTFKFNFFLNEKGAQVECRREHCANAIVIMTDSYFAEEPNLFKVITRVILQVKYLYSNFFRAENVWGDISAVLEKHCENWSETSRTCARAIILPQWSLNPELRAVRNLLAANIRRAFTQRSGTPAGVGRRAIPRPEPPPTKRRHQEIVLISRPVLLIDCYKIAASVTNIRLWVCVTYDLYEYKHGFFHGFS